MLNNILHHMYLKEYFHLINTKKERMRNYLFFLILSLNAIDHIHLQIPTCPPSLEKRTHAKLNTRNCFDTNYKESLNVINEHLLTIHNALRTSLFHRAESMMIELLAEFQTYQENISSFHSPLFTKMIIFFS